MLQYLVLGGVTTLLLYEFIYRERPHFDPKLDEIKSRVDLILAALNISIPYKLYCSKSGTYVSNKRNIYLYCNNKDIPQLVKETLHEIAHILCKDADHSDNFRAYFNILLSQAQTLNLL